jgi:hypothetical protein
MVKPSRQQYKQKFLSSSICELGKTDGNKCMEFQWEILSGKRPLERTKACVVQMNMKECGYNYVKL